MSERNVEITKAVRSRNGSIALNLLEGDIAAIPLPDNSMDDDIHFLWSLY